MAYKILSGNELIIQGGLEAGFSLYTGYPGSPLADFFNILFLKKEEIKKLGPKVVLANSEANAAAMASGAKMAGRDCLVAMKSMGLNVAADALSVGNFANPGEKDSTKKSGVVVVVGDDPWSISTSAPVDSRYLYQHLHIPFLEPADPQELKDWMKIALELSRESSVYVGILLTTFLAEGGGRVSCDEPVSVEQGTQKELDPDKFDLSLNVMVPPNSLKSDRLMIEERFPKYLKALHEIKLDRTMGNLESEFVFLSCGGAFTSLKQVLEDMDLISQVKLIKLAGSFPLDEAFLIEQLSGCKKIVIVEEKRGFLEEQIGSLLHRNELKAEVFGKKFKSEVGFPAHGGLSYEIVAKKVHQLAEKLGLSLPCHEGLNSLTFEQPVPMRLPTFCPGCPHRETLSLLKELRGILDKRGMKLISHGDVGCYSLSFLEPFKEMHDLSAMGQGGAMASGTDIFVNNPSVVLIGDSTFFHSGVSAVSNSVQLGHNITYIILDNDNTAMTGHQMTPRTGVAVDGSARPKQDIVGLVKSMGVTQVYSINPSDRYFYKNLLEEVVTAKGTKVIISNKECALTFHGRKKKEERNQLNNGQPIPEKTFYQINLEACEDCRVCVSMTGCPGLAQTEDAYGTKVTIDPQICVNDSYCTKLKACPSFEQVTVTNYMPAKSGSSQISSSTKLPTPEPVISLQQIFEGRSFRSVIIGVGGSGVTTISRVMAECCEDMEGVQGLDFKFVDQKGLAQRNGSVTSHAILFSKDRAHGQLTPLGGADLVISPDLIEGMRGLPFLSDKGIMIVDSKYQSPLSLLLDHHNELGPEQLQHELRDKLKERVHMYPFKDVSYKVFGRSVYSNAMILGFAFQIGRLPFSEKSVVEAIARATPKAEVENNQIAFSIGRDIAVNGEDSLFFKEGQDEEKPINFGKSIAEAYLLPWQKQQLVVQFNHWVKKFTESFPLLRPLHLKQYLHDQIVFNKGRNISDFFEKVTLISQKRSDQEELCKWVQLLAKTYWVKDEVYVAHQLSSPIKRERDLRKYGSLGSSFKVGHINRPEFDVFGLKLSFDIRTKPWMLKIMRHLRILRVMLPSWHKQERKINLLVRNELMNLVQSELPLSELDRFKELQEIKGYRQVRYDNAGPLLQKVER